MLVKCFKCSGHHLFYFKSCKRKALHNLKNPFLTTTLPLPLSLPQDAASACRKFIERDPEEARFALVALASAAE